MLEILKAGWDLDYVRIKMLLLAIIPGVIISIWSGELFWLNASFIAVCSIRSYTISHNSRAFTFANAILIYGFIYLILAGLKFNWYYLLVILPILALIGGIIDNIHKDLHSISVWLIIGSIYGAVTLSHVSLNLYQMLYLFLLTMFSIGLVVVFFSKQIIFIQLKLVSFKNPDFIFNFKYVLPIIITVLIWHIFNLQEPQWIFWSGLSVVYPDFSDSLFKLKQRVYGVVIGVSCGLLVGLLLPHSKVITYVCFIMVMLSIMMFKNYFPGFLLRCFFAVVYAGNLSAQIAFIRLSNVILGGIIGVLCTFLLIKFYQLRRLY